MSNQGSDNNSSISLLNITKNNGVKIYSHPSLYSISSDYSKKNAKTKPLLNELEYLNELNKTQTSIKGFNTNNTLKIDRQKILNSKNRASPTTGKVS